MAQLYSDELQEQIIQRYLNGKSLSELEIETGVNWNTIIYWLKKRNITNKIQHKKISDDEILFVRALVKDGISITKISEQLHIKRQRVKYITEQYCADLLTGANLLKKKRLVVKTLGKKGVSFDDIQDAVQVDSVTLSKWLNPDLHIVQKKQGRKPNFSYELDDEIIARTKNNECVRDIADSLNVSTIHVYKRLKYYGIDPAPKFSSEIKKQVRELLENGHTQHYISKQFNICNQTISYWAQKWTKGIEA